MNILFLSRLFYPHIGGVEKHVLELSKILLKKGHNVIVITENPASSATTKNIINFKFKGINIYTINNGKEDWFKKFRIWKNLWRLKDLMNNADIIHCHDVFFWYLPFRFLFPHKPVFTTFHGYEGFPIKKKAILMRKVSEKLSFGNICIGMFLQKYYGTKPSFVSYGAVNIIASDEGARQSRTGLLRHFIPRNDNALFIGRLDDQTGIIEYLKAFKKIKEKHPKFELLVVGDGKYKALTAKKTKVLGFQKNPEKYFKNYRFAFVSRYLSILEALAAKRLVFALYDNPVKEDYLKMSPFAKFIIIEKDPVKLAEKVLYYLNHPEEENKLITQGYNWASKQSWDALTEKYLSLWKKSSH
jgi:glycosyltransferase involved in cell wall biosynthesis